VKASTNETIPKTAATCQSGWNNSGTAIDHERKTALPSRSSASSMPRGRRRDVSAIFPLHRNATSPMVCQLIARRP